MYASRRRLCLTASRNASSIQAAGKSSSIARSCSAAIG